MDDELQQELALYRAHYDHVRLRRAAAGTRYRFAHPDVVKACSQRYYERLKADPTRLEERRRKAREAYLRKRRLPQNTPVDTTTIEPNQRVENTLADTLVNKTI